MTLSTWGTRTLLKSPVYQLPSITFSSSFSLSTLRLIPNIHRPSLQAYVNKKKPQFSTMSLSSSSPPPPLPPPERWTYRDSKRTPWLTFKENEADVIEKNMLDDGFRTWGIVTYRCTYKSDSDWEEFMRRFLHHVRATLEIYDGLDMLDSFVPTVMDDKTRLDGATPSMVRDYFNEWARTACETEQGVPFDRASYSHTARYRLCFMVDEEALQSVLDIPLEELDDYNNTGYVMLVNCNWEPEWPLSEEELEGYTSPPPEPDYEPVLGCTHYDVGWMKVCYDRAQILASGYMADAPDWRKYYIRPPEITFNY